jgi:hypothetical protein
MSILTYSPAAQQASQLGRDFPLERPSPGPEKGKARPCLASLTQQIPSFPSSQPGSLALSRGWLAELNRRAGAFPWVVWFPKSKAPRPKTGHEGVWCACPPTHKLKPTCIKPWRMVSPDRLSPSPIHVMYSNRGSPAQRTWPCSGEWEWGEGCCTGTFSSQ